MAVAVGPVLTEMQACAGQDPDRSPRLDNRRNRPVGRGWRLGGRNGSCGDQQQHVPTLTPGAAHGK